MVEQLCRRRQQLRGHRLAADDHVERGFHAHRARQALGATPTRQQAQLHFRQCDLRAFGCDAVVAAESEFQPATHASAGNRGDHRLAALLDGLDDAMQMRFGSHLRAAEFLDIGTTGEQAVVAREDHNLHGGIGFRPIQPGDDFAAGGVVEAVDRRVTEGEDGDVALRLVMTAHGVLGFGGRKRERVAACWRWLASP